MSRINSSPFKSEKWYIREELSQQFKESTFGDAFTIYESKLEILVEDFSCLKFLENFMINNVGLAVLGKYIPFLSWGPNWWDKKRALLCPRSKYCPELENITEFEASNTYIPCKKLS